MGAVRLLAALAVVLALVAAAAARTSTVTVRVAPTKVTAGNAIRVTARPKPATGPCTPRVTRPGARATKLASKKPRSGSASWRWRVPRAAKPGSASVRVACARAGSRTARFRIVSSPVTPSPPPPATGDPAAGKSVFLGNCGGCHTLRDAGTRGVVGPNLDERMPSYDKVVERVTNGRGIMPSFRGRLSEKEIADVAAYVSTVAGR